jgi:hypothetical protein
MIECQRGVEGDLVVVGGRERWRIGWERTEKGKSRLRWRD